MFNNMRVGSTDVSMMSRKMDLALDLQDQIDNNCFIFLHCCLPLLQDNCYVCEEREKNQQDATIRCLLLTSVSTCFGASLCPSSGEQRPCYCIWCVVLVLLDVVGSGCGALRCRMRALKVSVLFCSVLFCSVLFC